MFRMKMVKRLVWSTVLLWAATQGPITKYARAANPEPFNFLSPIEKEILQEINAAREAPLHYAQLLVQAKRYYEGKQYRPPGGRSYTTQEGLQAVDEAITFLRLLKPLPPLKLSRGMFLAAKDLIADQGPKGIEGHAGSDGSEVKERAERYGVWEKALGESIYYGSNTARDIVMGLIIDDGIPTRDHRKCIFYPDFKVVGVAFGRHMVYQTMSVMTFAGGFKEKDEFIKMSGLMEPEQIKKEKHSKPQGGL